ncbi:hypothetical protein NDU88_000208 [Pleurodeles waltl]|uniref:Uncharacterized protein n=1 Tax=Pleurodeles waltl TaxID=8319 RepID=A0AAV7Q2F4_PLEWA|nr:hypothetical protein NDU88_000208 [Pleurodeles waltl]
MGWCSRLSGYTDSIQEKHCSRSRANSVSGCPGDRKTDVRDVNPDFRVYEDENSDDGGRVEEENADRRRTETDGGTKEEPTTLYDTFLDLVNARLIFCPVSLPLRDCISPDLGMGCVACCPATRTPFKKNTVRAAARTASPVVLATERPTSGT